MPTTERRIVPLVWLSNRINVRLGKLEHLCRHGKIAGAYREQSGRWMVPLPLKVRL